jgi:hypothetical protein
MAIRVDHIYDPPTPEERDAYKIFVRFRGRLYTFIDARPVTCGIWTCADPSPLFGNPGSIVDSYRGGWHVFDSQEDAHRAVAWMGGPHFLVDHICPVPACREVRAVRIRSVRTSGMEALLDPFGKPAAWLPTVVADEMMVP